MAKRKKSRFPGVFHHVTDDSKEIFYIRYRRPGDRKLHEEKLSGLGWTLARAARERSARIAGKPSNEENRTKSELQKKEFENRPTLELLFERYLIDKAEQNGQALKSIRVLRPTFKKHFGHLVDRTTDDLTLADAQDIRKKILEQKGALKTVANVLGLLNSIVAHGVSINLCQPLSFKLPIPKRGEIQNKTTERLNPGQLDQLLKVLDEEPLQIGNFFRMALYSGCRKSEMCKLTWDDCDFDFYKIRLRNPKSGRDEEIPMSAPVKNILQSQWEIRNFRTKATAKADVVFFTISGRPWGSSEKIITQHSKRIREKAGLPSNFRMLHGLRHVFGTLHALHGTPLPILSKLLTHKTLSVTERYIEIAREDALASANLTGEIIQKHRSKRQVS